MTKQRLIAELVEALNTTAPDPLSITYTLNKVFSTKLMTIITAEDVHAMANKKGKFFSECEVKILFTNIENDTNYQEAARDAFEVDFKQDIESGLEIPDEVIDRVSDHLISHENLAEQFKSIKVT